MRSLLPLAPYVGAEAMADFAREARGYDPPPSDVIKFVTAMAGLVPKLDDGVKELLRRHAVDVAWEWIGLRENLVNVRLLTRLAPHLIALGDERRTLEALRGAAAAGADVPELAEIAAVLGGREQEELNKKILARVGEEPNPYTVVIALAEAATKLSEPLLREAIRTVKERCEAETIISEVAKLASRLAELGHPGEAREFARLIPQDRPGELSSALFAVAEASRGQERAKLLAEAFEAACRIQNGVQGAKYVNDRAEALRRLSPLLAELERRALQPIWEKGLRRLALNTRAEFLSDLGALAPVIAGLGGEDGVVGVREAIRDAGNWWP